MMNLDRNAGLGERVSYLLEYARYSGMPLMFDGYLWESDYIYRVEAIYPIGYVHSNQFNLQSIQSIYPNCEAMVREYGIVVYSEVMPRFIETVCILDTILIYGGF